MTGVLVGRTFHFDSFLTRGSVMFGEQKKTKKHRLEVGIFDYFVHDYSATEALEVTNIFADKVLFYTWSLL